MKRLIVINIILVMLFLALPQEQIPIEIAKVEEQVEEVQDEEPPPTMCEEIEEVVVSRSIEEPRQEKIINVSQNCNEKTTNISQNCIDLVKKFEGLYLEAYKLEGESKYTIGYGHSTDKVYAGQVITKQQAENYLQQDLKTAINCVNKLNLKLNQNQFDALVSFTFNCGNSNLKKLTANRTLDEIADHITAYTGSSSKNHKNGLTKRRLAEKELFLKNM